MPEGPQEAEGLYRGILEAWNAADAERFAAVFAPEGEVIGFDGSQVEGRDRIEAEMSRIFGDHPTGAYVGKILRIDVLGADVVLLRAVVGMVPPGASDIDPRLNAVQSLVAARRDGDWHVVLYQNTPAQFHGDPDRAEALTEELRKHLPPASAG